MNHEELWQLIKGMRQWQRHQLAYGISSNGLSVGYIHPHYYFDARAVHDILFYPPHSQHEINGDYSVYFNALKTFIEDITSFQPSREISVCFKRYKWLPRFVNDFREGRVVRRYVCSLLQNRYVNAWYRILPGDSLAGDRPRSLFITLNDGSEVVYTMSSHRSDRLSFRCTQFPC